MLAEGNSGCQWQIRSICTIWEGRGLSEQSGVCTECAIHGHSLTDLIDNKYLKCVSGEPSVALQMLTPY